MIIWSVHNTGVILVKRKLKKIALDKTRGPKIEKTVGPFFINCYLTHFSLAPFSLDEATPFGPS